MATAIQSRCERCQATLVPGSAYCDRCGERTRQARGMVRLTLRVELLVLALVVVMTVGFIVAFYVQR